MTLYRLDRPPGPCIGVDPGLNGGAAQYDGERWRAIEWRKRAKGWDVTDEAGDEWRVPSWHGEFASWLVYGDVNTPAAVEGVVYHAGKGTGLITLAEAAGQAVLLVSDVTAREVQRPHANRWRPDILGLGPQTPAGKNGKAGPCEVAAMHAVAGTCDPSRFEVGTMTPKMVDLGVGMRLGQHAAEAVCIALWAAGCRLARVDGVA